MSSLDELRKDLDQWHRDFERMLWQRRELTMQVWGLKKELGLPWICLERKKEIVRLLKESIPADSDPMFTKLTEEMTEELLAHFQTYLCEKYAVEGDSVESISENVTKKDNGV